MTEYSYRQYVSIPVLKFMSSAHLVQQFLPRFQSLPPKTKLSINLVKVNIKHRQHTK